MMIHDFHLRVGYDGIANRPLACLANQLKTVTSFCSLVYDGVESSKLFNGIRSDEKL
jgi:hypothetical protein